MRKTLVVFGLLALYLGFSCVPAQAQTAISLILTTGAVTFTTISPGSTAMASFTATGPALQISRPQHMIFAYRRSRNTDPD